MTYILMLYTVVALGNNPTQANDWRPIGEFHSELELIDNMKSAKEKCEEAARQLGLTPNRYRCVRSK